MNRQLFLGNTIVQGITGSHGSFHTEQMIAAGTNIVAGTSPSKAGSTVHNVPVYGSIKDIKQLYEVDSSVIFVPAAYTKQAIIEAIDEEIPLIVCITEGVPVHDMVQIKQRLSRSKTTLIGPNCPGISLPGTNKLGIIPDSFTLPGSVAIVSRSGTLTYEIAASLSEQNIGQRYIIGIGGDPIRGTSFVDCLEFFEQDDSVNSIILVGEIGGHDEQQAADYIAHSITKPVFAYIAGHSAPPGVQLGHAGAILGGESESADAKSRALTKAGAQVFDSVQDLVKSVSLIK